MELARFKLLIRERFRCVFFSEGGVNVSWNWVPCTFMFIWDLRFCFKRWYFIQVGWSALRTKTLSVFVLSARFVQFWKTCVVSMSKSDAIMGKVTFFHMFPLFWIRHGCVVGTQKKIVPFLFPSFWGGRTPTTSVRLRFDSVIPKCQHRILLKDFFLKTNSEFKT